MTFFRALKNIIVSNGRKLLLLIWKNYVLRKRHWFATTLDTLVPFIVLLLFWGILQAIVASAQVDVCRVGFQPKNCKGKEGSKCRFVQDSGGNKSDRSGPDTMLSPIYEKDLKISCGPSSPCVVAYFPKNADTENVIKLLSSDVSDPNIEWRGFATETEIEKQAGGKGGKGKQKPLRAAIVFENNFNLAAKSISYKIRMATSETKVNYDFNSYEKSGFLAFQFHVDKVLINLMTHQTNPDVFKGFSLQGIKHRQGGSSSDKCGRRLVGPHLGPISPSPKDIKDVRRDYVPVLIAIGFIFIVPSAMRGVINEKISGMKEFMKLCGIPSWMQWFTWTLNIVLFLTITITLIVTLLYNSIPACEAFKKFPVQIYTVFEYSDCTLVWAVLMLYVTTLTIFSFFISTFFSKAAIGIIVGLLFWIATFFAPIEIFSVEFYESLGKGVSPKLAFCLIPNVALYMALRIIVLYETEWAISCNSEYSYDFTKSQGVTWKKLFEPLSDEDDLSLGLVMFMLLIDMVIYMLLTLYFEAILPSKHGVRKPFYFIFLPSTYGLNINSGKAKVVPQNTVQQQEFEETGNPEPSKFEDEPVGLTAGVEIINLKKSFGFFNYQIAVNGLSMKMFQGEIFALLGHNGAGKTTTISCCIGETSLTSGTILINGFNIQTEFDHVRRQLGFCPQHNVLFDELTVDEHLYFFGMLKGMDSRAAKVERIDLIQKLRLTEKTSKNSKSLSGGQKRRLCLGNALIGHAKVVFLDEPTSGMDVETRRTIWDILLAVRNENWRTIILTTHFMEEADALGDRIGIMARGKLKCYGTNQFLKNAYGAGYTLNLSIANDGSQENILKVVQSHIPNAFVKVDAVKSGQLVLTLPTQSFESSVLPGFFTELESNKGSLGIKTIGLSLTTMDDVFLKASDPKQFMTSEGVDQTVPLDQAQSQIVGPDIQQNDNVSEPTANTEVTPNVNQDSTTVVTHTDENPDRIENMEIEKQQPQQQARSKRRVGCPPVLILIWSQFSGIMIKRFLYTVKTRSLIFTQMFIPVLVLWLAIIASEVVYKPKHEKYDPKNAYTKIGLDSYKRFETLYAATDPDMDKSFANAAGRSAKLYLPKGGNSLENELLNHDGKDHGKHVVAAEINSTHFIYIFSTSADHSPAIALNLASNTLLRKLDTSQSRLTLSVVNEPLRTFPLDPGRVRDDGDAAVKREFKFKMEIFRDVSALVFAVLSSIALALMAASFVSAVLDERICNGKQLQMMTGINPLVYWGATLVFDICVLLIVIIAMLVCFFGLQYETLIYYARFDVYVAIILVYGFAAIPISYLCSLYSKSVAGAFSVLAIVHVVTGVVLPFFVIVGELIAITLVHTGLGSSGVIPFLLSVVRFFSRMFPTFGATHCTLTFVYLTHVKAKLARRKARFFEHCIKTYTDLPGPYKCGPFSGPGDFRVYVEVVNAGLELNGGFKPSEDVDDVSWTIVIDTRDSEMGPPGIGQEMFYMIFYGMIYYAILILCEFGFIQSCCEKMYRKDKAAFELNNSDEDVKTEAERVQTLVNERQTAEDALVVSNLCKGFGSFAAVSNLTFGVHYGECFGMLGVNGAGKTTAFRMLTGDLNRSSGDAYMMNNSLGRTKRKFIKQIGYCPQFDGIIEVLTGRQMLELFARLRGLPHPRAEADLWIRKVGLQESANSQCGRYSGGMKRRLSAAMAMIGDSHLILLDEPTSGVDPVSRREFWKVIQSINESGRAIILTSHSMDEVTACCQRLGIMVNGMLQCFGSVSHLKDKFAQGFTLGIRLKPGVILESPEMEALHTKITERFAPCSFKDKHQTGLEYHIDSLDYPWSTLFQTMEEIKPNFEDLIGDYSFTETTLEEVFISFARMQYGARETKAGCCRRCLTN